MPVHVPLSLEAQAEARFLMIASNNILKPSDGEPITVPTQDMILGNYYLTFEKAGAKGEGKVFASPDEAILAYDNGDIDLQAKIGVRVRKEIDGKMYVTRLNTTAGRIIFNREIPQNLGLCERKTPEDMLKLEVDYVCGKKQIKKIIKACYDNLGSTETAKMLDRIKDLGYKYSTKACITACLFDVKTTPHRDEIIEKAMITLAPEGVSLGFVYSNYAQRYGFFESILKAWPFSFYICGVMLSALAGIFTGATQLKDLGGTVTAIGQIAEVSQMGFTQFLMLFPLLSLNLALFNILPIPALDGARAVFILIEMIFRKPVPRKIEGYIHMVGLILLFALVIFLDVYHFFFV